MPENGRKEKNMNGIITSVIEGPPVVNDETKNPKDAL